MNKKLFAFTINTLEEAESIILESKIYKITLSASSSVLIVKANNFLFTYNSFLKSSIVSIILFEKPHSLSYQDNTLQNLLFRTCV